MQEQRYHLDTLPELYHSQRLLIQYVRTSINDDDMEYFARQLVLICDELNRRYNSQVDYTEKLGVE